MKRFICALFGHKYGREPAFRTARHETYICERCGYAKTVARNRRKQRKMKLRDWISQVDGTEDVMLWVADDPEGKKPRYNDILDPGEEPEPWWKGSVYEIPWSYIDWEIGDPYEKEPLEKPICINIEPNERGIKTAYINIYIIPEDN